MDHVWIMQPRHAFDYLWRRIDLYLTSPRWRTAARMVRAGYNVLLMDTDVLVLDDPYRYWKKPPFDKYTLLVQVGVRAL